MKICDKCNKMFESYKYCPHCGQELKKYKFINGYDTTYGTWIVSKDLGNRKETIGIFEGYIDEIAFYLNKRGYERLHFKITNFQKVGICNKSRGASVLVTLDEESGIQSLGPKEILESFKILLKDRNEKIDSSNYQNSILLFE